MAVGSAVAVVAAAADDDGFAPFWEDQAHENKHAHAQRHA